MSVSLPYLVTYKNVPKLFENIASAKSPDKFSHRFLQNTIGLKGTNDRQLIPLLRHLGFIDQSGSPTSSYALLKSTDAKRAAAIAQGVRKAYSPLFDADEAAHTLGGEKLKGLVAQVAGTDDNLTARIAGTLSSLVKLGNFTGEPQENNEERKNKDQNNEQEDAAQGKDKDQTKMRTEFHYNIQVHLPSNATEETYSNIFNALRKTFT